MVPERGWGFATTEKMKEEIDKGLVLFREDHTKPPFRKAYLFSVDATEDIYPEDNDVGAQVMPSVIHKQAQVVAKFMRNMFNGERVFENPKDHEVLARLIKYVTGPKDLVLDSFAGSGSTGHAVLQINHDTGSERRFILVEMDETIITHVTLKRLQNAIVGYEYKESKGKTVRIAGCGGGVQWCYLGGALFNEDGQIHSDVRFSDLAAHVFFVETGVPLPKRTYGKTPLLGVYNGVAVYLLFNGILSDKTPQGGNVLTRAVLEILPPHDGPKVVYGTGCRLGQERLQREGITFRQIPYAVRIE